MDKKIVVSLAAYSLLLMIEWVVSWIIWEQFQFWNILTITTYTFYVVAVVLVTALFVCAATFFGSGNEGADEILIKTNGNHAKQTSFENIEEERVRFLSEKSTEEKIVEEKSVEPPQVGGIKEAKDKVEIARLEVLARKIISGEVEVIPTDEDMENLGIRAKEIFVNKSAKTTKFVAPSKSPDVAELEALFAEEEEKEEYD